MLSILQSIASLALMVVVGIVLAKRGWFDERGSALISRLVLTVALPPYLFSNLMAGYDRPKLLAMLPGLPVPFAVMIATMLVSRLVARLARVPEGRRGVFTSMFSLSNVILIGLPVNHVLFGDESLPFVLLYYVGNTSMFWTVGVYQIARDGAVGSGRAAARIVSREGIKRVLSPPLLGFLSAAIFILLGIEVPPFLLGVCRTIGGMTAPLSMIFIGIVISGVPWRRIKPDLEMACLLLGRFVASPLVLFLAVRWTDLPLLMKQVFFVQAAMPAMTQTPIIAKAYRADAEYAALMTSVTTIASLATIPICMALVNTVW